MLKRLDVRLAFWYTATFLAIIVVLFGFLDYRFRRNLLRETDRMLVDEAREIVSEVRKEPQATALPLQEYERAVSLRKYYRIAFQVMDRTGMPLYTSSLLRGFAFPGKSFADLLPDQPVTENVRVHGRGSPFRVCTYAHGKQGETLYVVQIATYLRRMEKNIRNFREVLFIAFILAFLFGSLGGWFLSRRSLRPIGRLTRTTTRITAASLNERLPLRDSGDELDCLAMTINQMIARLEASFQRLTQFTGDAAHELRTPVAALRGEAEVLLSRTRTAEEYREALSNSLERLDFLTKLINDLLFLSQADEGKDATQFETVNLTHTLHELWEAFDVVAEQKNIRFEFQGPSQALISGDRTRLTQLFSNLMDNAIKYTPAGGSIALSLTLDAGRAVTTLQDTGVGIPAEDLPFLFDRFYRVDKSRSRESGGTGLGLSICRQIVRTHHGTIQVKSTPNKGTTVIVTLPA